MADESGQNDSRTLSGGEIVYLVKEPGAKWRIRSYECGQGVAAGGLLFVWMQGLPAEWKDLEFDDADAAAGFAQDQINQGKVPRNSEQGVGG